MKYIVDNLIPENDCKIILDGILSQEDKFKITDEFGLIDLSVYECSFYNLNDDKVKKMLNYYIHKLSKKLGVNYGTDKSIIIYKDDKIMMKPHYDGGTSTTIIYLNNDFEGGGTGFPLLERIHKPQDHKPGHFLHYSSTNLFAYHAGMPVTKGIKVAVVLKTTKWFPFYIFTAIPWAIFVNLLFEPLVISKLLKERIDDFIFNNK